MLAAVPGKIILDTLYSSVLRPMQLQGAQCVDGHCLRLQAGLYSACDLSQRNANDAKYI